MTYSLPGTGILQLHIFPLKPREAPEIAGHRVQVAVFLMRPGPQTLNAGEVAIQFGLTSAESRLAVLLTEGKTVAEAAKVAGISMATARTHLRNILQRLQPPASLSWHCFYSPVSPAYQPPISPNRPTEMANIPTALYLQGGPGLNCAIERVWLGENYPVLWWDQPRFLQTPKTPIN